MKRSYDHALVIKNEQSSKLKNYSDTEFKRAVVEPLIEYGFDTTEIDILNRPNDTELDSSIKRESLLVLCGGDGTIARIAGYAINNSLSNTILPRPFGGANDIATGLYGRSSMNDILKNGASEPAYSIEAIVQKENEEQKSIRALGYIGIGASGQAAKAINEYQCKGSTEFGAIIRAAAAATNSRPFIYSDSIKSQNEAFEILAINNRMARYIHSKYNSTFSPEFTLIEANNKSRMMGKLCLGALGIADGTTIVHGQTRDILVLSDTILQSDGEDTDIEAGTTISFKNGPSINILRV